MNAELKRMGNNIGVRLIDEYLSKTSFHQSPSPASSSSSSPPDFNNGVCRSLRETADSIAKVGFKMFLGVTADTRWTSDNEVALIFKEEIPLNDFVELPETLSALHYSNIVCGVVRGALEMVRRDYPRRLPRRPACRSQPPAQCHVPVGGIHKIVC